jgi:hypothetical protein
MGDAGIAALVTPQLVALNLAGTPVSGFTFMTLGQLAPGDSGLLGSGGRGGSGAASAAAAMAALQLGGGQPAAPGPAPPPPSRHMCALRALDVSRCPSLVNPPAGAQSYKSFQAALGRLVALEGGFEMLHVDVKSCCILPPVTPLTSPTQNTLTQTSLVTELSLRGCNINALFPASALQGAINNNSSSATTTSTTSTSSSAGSQVLQPAAPWVATLQRLTALDVSDAKALSPATMAPLLQGCAPLLRRLAATGCRTLAGGDIVAGLPPAQPAAARDERTPPSPALPSLHALSAGWGFSRRATAALIDSSPFLTRLELGLGAEMDDGLLERAAGCPHLQQLTLRLAAVGTAGERRL